MSNSSDPPKDLNKNFDPLSKYAWGDLNPILTQISTKKWNDGSNINSLRITNLKSYEQNILRGVHHFKAIVLRVEVPGPRTSSDGWHTTILADDNIGISPGDMQKVEIKGYIPEIHGSILPRPTAIAGPPGAIDHVTIDMYPTFIAKDASVSGMGIPKPGDLIWVDFGNRENFQDPLYLGPVFGGAMPAPQAGKDVYGRPCVPELPEISKVDDIQAGQSVNVPTTSLQSTNVNLENIVELEQQLNYIQMQISAEQDPDARNHLILQEEEIRQKLLFAVEEANKESEKQEIEAAKPLPCEVNSSLTSPGPATNPLNVGEFTTVELLPNTAYTERRVFLNVFGTLDKSDAVSIPTISGKIQQHAHPLLAARLQLLNEAWLTETGATEQFLVSSGLRDGPMKRYKWLIQPNHYKFKRAGLNSKGPMAGPVKLTEALEQDGTVSYSNLKRLFDAFLEDEYGSVATGRQYRAWASPHETGLAVDFGNNGLKPSSKTNAQQKRTPAFLWLKENAYRFGFNPYIKEAWHWEVIVPVENFQSGEEFVLDGNYAVYPKEILNKGPKSPMYANYWRKNTLANEIA